MRFERIKYKDIFPKIVALHHINLHKKCGKNHCFCCSFRKKEQNLYVKHPTKSYVFNYSAQVYGYFVELTAIMS